MRPTATRARRSGVTGSGRRILSELILVTLAQMKGRARAGELLRAVRERAEPYVPKEWRKAHSAYRSRIDMYCAFERATLRDEGLVDATERGFWKLTPAGWERAKELAQGWKNGSAQPSAPVEQLFWNGKAGWIGRVLGSMRDEPDFAKVVRLGREIRRADRPT